MSSALGWSQTCDCSISMMGPWVEHCRRSSLDLQRVKQGAAKFGLSLNHEKSKVISIDPGAREPLLTAVRSLNVTNSDCASLLGSPPGWCGLHRSSQL